MRGMGGEGRGGGSELEKREEGERNGMEGLSGEMCLKTYPPRASIF